MVDEYGFDEIRGGVVGAVRVARAFDDPDAIVAMVHCHGPYPSIATYLPPTATRGDGDDQLAETTPAWFRGNWAVAGTLVVGDASVILHNERFIEAAKAAFGATDVTPTTIVVNVNAPMPAGAIHLDIPSFRGANRDTYPLRLLQAMGTSGLFEPWRIVEAGAVTWFYDGPGGSYDYWPEGLDGPMCSVAPPYRNVALVADNDRIYHRIGAVGPSGTPPSDVPATSTTVHRNGGWDIVDDGQVIASYTDVEVRISILWKAQVHTGGAAPDALTMTQVVDIICTDLARRGINVPTPATLDDVDWLDLVHRTYYPPVQVA